MFWFLTAATDPSTTPDAGEVVEEVSMLDKIFSFDWGLPGPLQNFVNKCIEVVVVFIVLLILCKIVDIVTKRMRARMTKRNVEKTIVQVVYYLSLSSIVQMLTRFQSGSENMSPTPLP